MDAEDPRATPPSPLPGPAPSAGGPWSLDPYAPAEMALRAERGGAAKVALGAADTLALAVLAGAFVGLGAMLATVAGTSPGLGWGPSRLLAGVAFSLGLVLVVVGGAELFTGNNLVVMAWAHRRVSTAGLLRNWALVYAGNFAGALATAVGIHLAGIAALGDHQVGAAAVSIAAAKAALPWTEAFVRGAYGNALVCLAVWLAYSARTTTDKILAVVFPVTAFVAAGFEHSVANMYLLPAGLLLLGGGPAAGLAAAAGASPSALTWEAFLVGNLVPVTLGNVLGGAGMVGLVYWFVYLRGSAAN